MSKLTAENLKEVLWETLKAVRAKKLDHSRASAIASQSREIVRVVRTEIQLSKMPGSKITGFGSPKNST